jgi:surfeit locus 1 family protein
VRVRRLLSPACLGLGLIAAVAMAAMTWLGLWQFGVYDNHQRADAERVLLDRPVSLASLLGPDQAFSDSAVGRPVTVSGRWLADQQVYVHRIPNAAGRWGVVTPLVTSTGSAIMVVRGSVADLATARRVAALPSGPVTVHGTLEPSTSGSGPPDGQRVMSGLSVPSLVNAVKPDLYAGYLIASESRTSRTVLGWSSAPRSWQQVPPPLPDPSKWAGVRNLLYACQWWVFAAFAAVMWWRISGEIIKPREPEDVASDTAPGPLTSLG